MSDGSASTPTEPMDVGAILEALRADVRARRQGQNQAISPLERDLRHSLDELELYRVVSAHWPLQGRTLPQRVIVLINKLVRRYLRWYINPIVEQQNAYNDAVTRALHLLAEAYTELGEQIAGVTTATSDQPAPAEAPPTADRGAGTPLVCDGRPAPGAPQYGALMATVRARAATEPPARFPDLELRAVEPQLRLRQEVSAHWPLGGRTPVQRAIALVNKLVRRYLRWYINPIVEQQNSANAAFSAAILRMIALDAARRAEVARLRAHRSARAKAE